MSYTHILKIGHAVFHKQRKLKSSSIQSEDRVKYDANLFCLCIHFLNINKTGSRSQCNALLKILLSCSRITTEITKTDTYYTV